MPLNENDQLHLKAAACHLQFGDAMDAWHELEMIAPTESTADQGTW